MMQATLTATRRNELWQQMLAGVATRTNDEKLREIHAFIRRYIKQVSDEQQWQEREFWEPPETVLNTGMADCDGKAILAFTGAYQAGVDWPLGLAVIARLGKEHMVLFCGKYVLDSAAKNIYLHYAAIPVYYTFNLHHLFVRKPTGETLLANSRDNLGQLRRAFDASPMLKAIA